MSHPKYNVYSNNIEVNCGEYKLSVEGKNYTTFEHNLQLDSVGEVGFVDAANKNYALRDDSGVFEKIPGFARIDFNAIGPYTMNPEDKLGECVLMLVGSGKAMDNGEVKLIDEDNAEVKATVVNGRTVVPIRFVSETFGAIVSWNEETGEAVVKNRGNSITFPTDENAYYYNGERFETEAGAMLENDRVLIPIRVISELLSRKVYYHPKGLIAIYTEEDAISALSDDNVLESIIKNLR